MLVKKYDQSKLDQNCTFLNRLWWEGVYNFKVQWYTPALFVATASS